MNNVTRKNSKTVKFSYSNVDIWGIALCGAETSDISERKSDIPGKCLTMVLEKEGEYQLDRKCEK